MNLIKKIFFRIYQKRVINYTNDLCYHMNQVYHYILSSNQSVQDRQAIAEAIGLLETWKKISTNVYKHIASNTSIEIDHDSKLVDITKKILNIEIDYIIKNQSEKIVQELKKEACARVDDYFDSNQVIVSKGDK